MTAPSAAQPKRFIHAALVDTLQPDCQDDGHEPDRGRDQAVTRLKQHATRHLRNDLAVRERPIGARTDQLPCW